jgi:hypothetical protein
LMRIRDPGWKKFDPEWEKFGSGIRDKHPGSAPLEEMKASYEPVSLGLFWSVRAAAVRVGTGTAAKTAAGAAKALVRSHYF